MTLAGLTLQKTLGTRSPQMQRTTAIAVPILLLRGDFADDLEVSVPPAVFPSHGLGLDAEGAPVVPPPLQIVEEYHPPADDPPPPDIPPEPPLAELPPSFGAVSEEYYDGVLFLGDSRTVGLALYGRMGSADYFADVGMNLFNLFKKSVGDQNFASQSLEALLGKKKYHTIYLMLGINELNYNTKSITQKLTEVLEHIKTLQPDAVLVLEANLAVTKHKESSSNLTLTRIREVNALLAARADGESILYLDVNPYFCDSSGYLRSDVTSDGVHPYAAEYKAWAQWLKDNGGITKFDPAR
jgi:lysophospholipase L1-like esterase